MQKKVVPMFHVPDVRKPVDWITNGSARMQSRKLECLAISSMFDAVLISDAEGVSKPDPQIFRRALERLDTRAAHAVFVGDHPK